MTTKLDEGDYETHKIFVGGLNRGTDVDSLRSYFQKCGEVIHTEVVSDKSTGRSRGFGFVTFDSAEAVDNLLKRSHRIEGVLVDVKKAVRKERARELVVTKDESNRIFVGGISDRISDEKFREYFAQYGNVISYNYLCDKATTKPRGFGFVIYDSQEACQRAIGFHTSLGRHCEAKKAQPKQHRDQAPQQPIPQTSEPDLASLYYQQLNMLYNPYMTMMANQNANLAPSNPTPHDPNGSTLTGDENSNPMMMQQLAFMNNPMFQQMMMNPALMNAYQMPNPVCEDGGTRPMDGARMYGMNFPERRPEIQGRDFGNRQLGPSRNIHRRNNSRPDRKSVV